MRIQPLDAPLGVPTQISTFKNCLCVVLCLPALTADLRSLTSDAGYKKDAAAKTAKRNERESKKRKAAEAAAGDEGEENDAGASEGGAEDEENEDVDDDAADAEGDDEDA